MKTRLLTSGEFARLCGTQKGTLLFYDKEGLLKPRYVSENGYRRYAVEQYFEFEYISVLKKTGSSLSDIKRCLHYENENDFIVFIKERYDIINTEIERLKQIKLMIRDIIEELIRESNVDEDVLTIQYHEEECFEVIPSSSERAESKEDVIQSLAHLTEDAERQHEKPRAPFGDIYALEDVMAEKFVPMYFFNRVKRSTPQKRRYVKSKGQYAVMKHKGTMETHQTALKRMLEQVKQAGMTIKSDIFAYDIMSFMMQKDQLFYTQKYCVRI